MAETSRSWVRPKYVAGGGNARLFYKIQGCFARDMRLDPRRYGGCGMPEGCTLQSYDQQRHADVLALGLDAFAGQQLRQLGQDRFSRVAKSPQCLVIRGQVEDPETFDYFRDVMGLILAALDGGGIAVYDPLLQSWWTEDQWRAVALSSSGFAPSLHTQIIVSPEDDSNLRWVRTRGMLKFGRPDISIRDVPEDVVSAAEELCEMLIEALAFGVVMPDGQEIRSARMPGGWRCTYAGHASDPEFNNVHLEVRRVA